MVVNKPSLLECPSHLRKKADPNCRRAKAARARNKNPCLACKKSRQKCSGGSRCWRCGKRNIPCEPGESVAREATIFIMESGLRRPRSNTVRSATSIASPITEADEGEDRIVSLVSPASESLPPTNITNALSPTTELSSTFSGLAVSQPGPPADSTTTSVDNKICQQHEQTLTAEAGTRHFHLGLAPSPIDDATQHCEVSQFVASESLSVSIPENEWTSDRTVWDSSTTYAPVDNTSNVLLFQGQQNQTFTGRYWDITGSTETDSNNLRGSQPYGPAVSPTDFSHPTTSNELQLAFEQLHELNNGVFESWDESNYWFNYYYWYWDLLASCLAPAPLREDYSYTNR